MKIFPLSVGGKVALIIIAIVLGLIWSMLQYPDYWMNKLRKHKEKKQEKNSKK